MRKAGFQRCTVAPVLGVADQSNTFDAIGDGGGYLCSAIVGAIVNHQQLHIADAGSLKIRPDCQDALDDLGDALFLVICGDDYR
jgi:hypothetical protein